MLKLDPKCDYGKHYDILPMIVNELDMHAIAEIGVHSGRLTDAVLKNCSRVLVYYMIDPWLLPKCKRDYAQAILKRAVRVRDRHNGRAVMIRKTSEDAVTRFVDETLDFVYIDGNHSYDHVMQDIALWWPKIVTGGWIGGHDYESEHGPDVRRAIEDAPELRGLRVYHGYPPSNWHGVWMVRK